MKKLISIGSAIFFLVALVACGGTGKSVEGEMTTDEFDGMSVYLYSFPHHTLLDSTVVKDRSFRLALADSLALYDLRVQKSRKDYVAQAVPIVAGEGNVKVYMGDKVVTTGTYSNDRLQDFLLAMDKFYLDCVNAKMQTGEIAPAFKTFLMEQVNANLDSPVGAYLLLSYKSRFTADEYEQLKGKVKAEYQSLFN